MGMRIQRLMDQWIDSRSSARSAPLSDYECVVRGDLEGGQDVDETPLRSYALKWGRMQSMLKRQVSADNVGADSAWDAGLSNLSGSTLIGTAGNGLGTMVRSSLGRAPLSSPLPMFSGLQDGFERL
jgi:hypothetical protein